MPAPTKALRINRWLPYWAVFQMDVRQTTRSWLFRIWLLAAAALSIGYLLHRAAIHYQAGMLQYASSMMGEVLQFALLVGTTLVIILTAGAISADRGTMADSVLSRGISRYQYFMGKWHSRLATILGSFLILASVGLIGSAFLLRSDLAVGGSLIALILVASILAVIVSCGVTVSAVSNSTVRGIAILWMAIYGVGALLWMLDARTPFNPLRLLRIIPALLRGEYHLDTQVRLIGWCLAASVAAAAVGLVHFSRRDV